jgi:hypothetical protein
VVRPCWCNAWLPFSIGGRLAECRPRRSEEIDRAAGTTAAASLENPENE